MRRRGGRVLAISADPADASARLFEQLELPFAILVDAGARVAASFGLRHGDEDSGAIAIPAHALLAPPDGRIVWRRASRKVQDRPDPADVLAAIETL